MKTRAFVYMAVDILESDHHQKRKGGGCKITPSKRAEDLWRRKHGDRRGGLTGRKRYGAVAMAVVVAEATATARHSSI
jgi:hypothetical protein